jgi:N4-gp56 family major capsid protein
MANLNTFSTIDVGAKVVRHELIDILKQNLVFYKSGKMHKVNIGANSKTVVWRQYAKLALATTALTEGTVPGGHTLSMSNITATLAEYGDFTEVSDILQWLNDRSSIKDASEVLGIQASETLDTLVVNVLDTCTNVLYGDGSVASRVTTTAAMTLTTTQVRRLARFLKRNNVKPYKGFPGVRPSYLMFVHPDVSADIQGDTNFVNAVNYSSPTPDNPNRGDLFTGELGYWMNVRFVETTIAPIHAGAGAAGADIYSSIIVGEGAYGVTEISGGLQTFIHEGGEQDTSNPLEQFSTVGWKWFGAAVILDQNRIVKNETAATYHGASV